VPIRLRLALFAAVGALALVTIGGWIFVRQLDDGLRASVDASLRARADTVVQAVRSARAGQVPTSRSTPLLPSREAIAQILDVDGTVIEHSEEAGRDALVDPGVARSAAVRPLHADGHIPHESQRVRFLVTRAHGPDGVRLVLVGSSLESADDAVTRVRTGILVGGGITVVIAAIGAWLLATLALRPVERMRTQAASISVHDTTKRLAVPETRDEIAELGETMNELLDRLQDALAQQRAFVADAGHELRTPLSILRTELELAARPGRDEVELRQAVMDASAETDRLSLLAEELLFLARQDEGVTRDRKELQPLHPLLERSVDLARARASAKGVDLQSDSSFDLVGVVDGPDLRRAVDNLLDNALRFAPAGSAVELDAWREGKTVVIRVRDRGPGFPLEFVPHAFERFRRADASRSRADGGSGLGLAIVRAVAKQHGGDAEVANRPGGGADVKITIRVDDAPEVSRASRFT
jgi:two-component system OmpR family sensor kinase